jgi:hypothetical protein
MLIACGALDLTSQTHLPFLDQALATEGDLTGARYRYGFFAPNIPNQALDVVTLVDSTGTQWVEVYGRGTSEMDHRITTMMAFFTVEGTDNLHAASLAAYVLGHHPEARRVLISLRCYTIPTMREYRNGALPSANEYYSGTFARRADLLRDGGR